MFLKCKEDNNINNGDNKNFNDTKNNCKPKDDYKVNNDSNKAINNNKIDETSVRQIVKIGTLYHRSPLAQQVNVTETSRLDG